MLFAQDVDKDKKRNLMKQLTALEASASVDDVMAVLGEDGAVIVRDLASKETMVLI